MYWLTKTADTFLFKLPPACAHDQAFARDEGITALPRVSVYRPGEGRLINIDVPFSRVKVNIKCGAKFMESALW